MGADSLFIYCVQRHYKKEALASGRASFFEQAAHISMLKYTNTTGHI